MKRVLIIPLCLFCGYLGVLAQYRVYAYEGQVMCKNPAKQSAWKAVVEDMELSATDSLYIAPKAVIRVEYMPQNKTYTIRGEAKNNIYQLIRDAKNTLAVRILRGLNISILSGQKDTMSHSIHAMEVLGGVSRATQVSSVDYDNLAEQLAWIGAQACTQKKSPIIDGVTLKRHKLSGGELDFEFDNLTDNDYYINILHVNKRTHTLSLCYVITPEVKANACPITPSGFCSCAMDVYFPDGQDDVYVLVALKEPYDSYTLDNELLYYRTDKAKKVQTDIQYMW